MVGAWVRRCDGGGCAWRCAWRCGERLAWQVLDGTGEVAALKSCGGLPIEHRGQRSLVRGNAMAVTGILSGLFGIGAAQGVQTAAQKLKQEFQQLGRRIWRREICRRRKDGFSRVAAGTGVQGSGASGGAPTGQGSTASAGSTTGSKARRRIVGNPVTQAFQQLAQDLKSGKFCRRRNRIFSTLQQDSSGRGGEESGGAGATRASASPAGRRERRKPAAGSGNPISTLFSQLGQALQAGNLTAAQTAYGSLQADFAQFSQGDGLSTGTGSGTSSGTSTGSGAGGVSFDA